MDYKKKVTTDFIENTLKKGVRDMPQNPGAQGYTARQIRGFYYIPEREILIAISNIEDDFIKLLEELKKNTGDGGSVEFGETEGTAYEGHKGKQNADDIAELKNKVDNLEILEVDMSEYQPKTDETLETESKEVAGAINELNGGKADKVDFAVADNVDDVILGYMYGNFKSAPTDHRPVTNTANRNSIPYRDYNGNFLVGDPIDQHHCTNKKYVDNKFNGANKALSFGNYETMISSFNALPKDTYNVGQNVMIVTLEVPDLWISNIHDYPEPYTYASDEFFLEQLTDLGYVKVGYYVLSALETQKVDLSDYQSRTDNMLLTDSKEVVGAINQLYADKVSFEDYATSTKAGVVKIYDANNAGLNITDDGVITLTGATDYIITHPKSYNVAVRSGQLYKWIKQGVAYNDTILTEEEQARVLGWLGVGSSGNGGKLYKHTVEINTSSTDLSEGLHHFCFTFISSDIRPLDQILGNIPWEEEWDESTLKYTTLNQVGVLSHMLNDEGTEWETKPVFITKISQWREAMGTARIYFIYNETTYMAENAYGISDTVTEV